MQVKMLNGSITSKDNDGDGSSPAHNPKAVVWSCCVFNFNDHFRNGAPTVVIDKRSGVCSLTTLLIVGTTRAAEVSASIVRSTKS